MIEQKHFARRGSFDMSGSCGGMVLLRGFSTCSKGIDIYEGQHRGGESETLVTAVSSEGR